MPTSKVTAVNFLSRDVFELVLERDGMDFQPGDCFAISNPNGVSRPYSASSGDKEPYLRFVIRRMPNGRVSQWLAGRSPGDEVEISQPFGWFRPGTNGTSSAPCVMVATGTGIAPFLSTLRSCPDLQPLVCLYGVRYLADAVGLDYLRDRCPLRLCVSREEAPPHHHGRVTDLLSEWEQGTDTFCATTNAARRCPPEGRSGKGCLSPFPPRTNYYLCGLDAMIDEVSGWLQHHGVHFTCIYREVFFNA